MGDSLTDDLHFLLGDFAGTDTVHPSAWTAADEASAVVTGAAELAGTLLVLRHAEQRTDGGRFEAVNVFARDPDSGEVLLYLFDSLGHPPEPPARGRFRGRDLVLDRRTTRGEACTTYSPTEGGFRWTKEFRPDTTEAWQPVVTGELRRVADEPTDR